MRWCDALCPPYLRQQRRLAGVLLGELHELHVHVGGLRLPGHHLRARIIMSQGGVSEGRVQGVATTPARSHSRWCCVIIECSDLIATSTQGVTMQVQEHVRPAGAGACPAGRCRSMSGRQHGRHALLGADCTWRAAASSHAPAGGATSPWSRSSLSPARRCGRHVIAGCSRRWCCAAHAGGGRHGNAGLAGCTRV